MGIKRGPIEPRMTGNEIKVLVVDDDEDMRATLMDFISRMGAVVKTAADVSEAKRALTLESTPFELVLTDLRLPGGSGLDIVKAAHLRAAETLVTIITGFASLETAIEAVRLGAYDYITKPFSLDEIGVQVRNMMERVALSKENSRLSLRLQQLYEELNRLQNDRSEALRVHEDIRRDLRENSRKLDRILSTRTNGSMQVADPTTEKAAFSGLFRDLEKLARMKGNTSASLLELEEKKRDLIEGFVDRL
jgi:DNA-binding NtrC family response regulator